jgi:iron complex transport system substrate-binding protein
MAACGNGGAVQNLGAQTAPAASPTGDYQPVTLTDCVGQQSVFQASPRRVVAMDQGTLNLLLYLGLGDRIAGWVTYAGAEGVFPAELQDAGPKVPILTQHPVPAEVLFGAGPDFVIGSFSSDFDGDQVASQQELADRGINSYRTFSTGCETGASQPVTSLDAVYQDLDNLGQIFGAEERADELITQMRTQVDEVVQAVAGAPRPRVFFFEFDEYSDAPFATGNQQNINAVAELAGAANIFSDIDESYQRPAGRRWSRVIPRSSLSSPMTVRIPLKTRRDSRKRSGSCSTFLPSVPWRRSAGSGSCT